MAKLYREAYAAKFGKWDYPDTLFSDVWQLLIHGIEKAQSVDPEKVAAALREGGDFQALSGPARVIARPDMGVNRAVDVMYQAYVRKVVDGKGKIIATIPLDEANGYLQKFFGWK